MPTPCLVTHVGGCADTMSAESILMTVEAHGVLAYTTVENVVYVFESATIVDPTTRESRDASEWIKAPTTIHALAAWLGY